MKPIVRLQAVYHYSKCRKYHTQSNKSSNSISINIYNPTDDVLLSLHSLLAYSGDICFADNVNLKGVESQTKGFQKNSTHKLPYIYPNTSIDMSVKISSVFTYIRGIKESHLF